MNALTAMAYTKMATLAPVLAKETAATSGIGVDVGEKFTELYKQVLAFANPAAIFAVGVCAVYLIFGSDPSWIKKAKSWGISIFFGIVILNLAPKIVEWAMNIN